ncbi:carboxypeptidase-like regulatory domain-containing protein [Thermostilla marina]
MKAFRIAVAVLVAALCATSISCSDTERLDLPNATLEGTITYKGQPVPYALVVVVPKAGGELSATGNADREGHYKVEYVPVGEVLIGVNTEAGKGIAMEEAMAAAQGPGAPPMPKMVEIPQKFFEPSTSGITTTIQEGANTFDIVIPE